MAIGGILAILDKRYRVPKKYKNKAAIASNKNVGSVNGNTRPISESS
jgi:hypothetical protein